MTHVLVSAAEASGDQHAAHVVEAIRAARPEIEFTAFGGPSLARAAGSLEADLVGSATMVLGFVGELGKFARILRRFDEILATRRPDAVLCVDSPGLHFLFARLAAWQGVPVIYYICPQIWAWAPWRRRKVLRYTDLLLPILPFEEELYGGGSTQVRYVGHPLADELHGYDDASRAADLRREWGISEGETLVGVFPGSRAQEVSGLSGVFCRLVRRASEGITGVRTIVSCYREAFRPAIEEAAARAGLEVSVHSGDARLLMRAADVALVASGTAALELAWFGTPMVVLYRTNAAGRFFFETFRVTPWIALPNILGAALNDGEAIVRERLFVDDPVEEEAPALARLIGDRDEREKAAARLRALRESVLRPGGIRRAADAVIEFLDALPRGA